MSWNESAWKRRCCVARRLAPSLTEQEAEFLLKINSGVVPDTIRTRCAELTTKAQQETLTKAERKELESLVDEIELLNAECIDYLAQLAQLRQQPLDKLMAKLEIQPLSYE